MNKKLHSCSWLNIVQDTSLDILSKMTNYRVYGLYRPDLPSSYIWAVHAIEFPRYSTWIITYVLYYYYYDKSFPRRHLAEPSK